MMKFQKEGDRIDLVDVFDASALNCLIKFWNEGDDVEARHLLLQCVPLQEGVDLKPLKLVLESSEQISV